MAYSTRTVGIIVASIIAVVLLGIAFLISGPLPFHFLTANAESTHDLLVSYAAKDTDGDGLPDWEEVLYGTDPNNPHSVSATLSDSEAVAQGLVKPKFANATTTPVDAGSIPGVTTASSTLTDQFARSLFSEYLSKRGATPPTSADVATFVESGVKSLAASQVTPDAFNAGEVRVVGTGPDALKTYSSAVEQVFSTNAVPATQSEVLYFSDAVNKNDASALAKVSAIGTEYAKIANALIKVPVPKEVAGLHLQFANALMKMSEVTLDFAAIKTDPLRAMLGLAQYEQDGTAVVVSLTALHQVFANEGVTFTQSEKGYSFYQSTLEASEASTAKP